MATEVTTVLIIYDGTHIKVTEKIWYGMGSCRGKNNGNSKITEKDVIWIRKNYPRISQTRMARKFGISISGIHLIIHRYNWSHVK